MKMRDFHAANIIGCRDFARGFEVYNAAVASKADDASFRLFRHHTEMLEDDFAAAISRVLSRRRHLAMQDAMILLMY